MRSQANRDSGPFPYLAFILLPIVTFWLGWTLAEQKGAEEQEPMSTEVQLRYDDGTPILADQVYDIDVSLLEEALEIAEEKYVDPEAFDEQEISYGIVRGMIRSLGDPYSEFMTPEQNGEFQDHMSGKREGIGAELTVKHGSIVVVSPLRDSPAEQAGLVPGDIILEVDGEEAKAEEFYDVVQRIRGEKGTEVLLTVYRPQEMEEKEVAITRDAIRIETVEVHWEEDVAVLEVSQFGKNTKQEFTEALEAVLSESPRGIVLDLRYNSGGILATAVDMLSMFISGKELVVTQQERDDHFTNLFTDGKTKTDLPLIVLQNGGSASASEIVAGALQDLGRAVVIGDQSFGKGTVQEIVQMDDNKGYIKITIAKWLTPNGNNINEVGITPNLVIENTFDENDEEIDLQMQAAVRYLHGESLEDIQKSLHPDEEETEEMGPVVPEDEEETVEE